ncbi:MAG: glycine/sarcosine/betaine reductase selenoprotein B family protein [Actinomycetota bacterium]
MGLFKKLRVWELFGRMMNSPVGTRFIDTFRKLVEKAMRLIAAGKREEPPAFTPWRKPLAEARVSLITTAGVHLAEQEPFDTGAALGDSSYRPVPSGCDVRSLCISHTHFPLERAQADINVILPIERLRELAGEGVIASVGEHHYCFGFDLHVKELVDPATGTAHEIARALRDDGVDVVLLTPG